MIVGLVPGNFRGSAHCASRRPSSRASSGKLVLSALGFRTHRFSARVARRGRSLEPSKVRVLLVNSLVRAISRAVAPRAPSFCDASLVPSSRTTTERRPTVGASGGGRGAAPHARPLTSNSDTSPLACQALCRAFCFLLRLLLRGGVRSEECWLAAAVGRPLPTPHPPLGWREAVAGVERLWVRGRRRSRCRALSFRRLAGARAKTPT